MKLLSPSLVAVVVSLVTVPAALAMDKRQADATCATWKLECPEGASSPGGAAKKSGALECKAQVKGRSVKEGPAVTCRNGEAQAFGGWKAGRKHGRHVTMRPDGSWTEEDFVEGKLQGRSVEYSAEGQLLKEASFQGGKRHGPARTYTEDGRLASEEHWERGQKRKRSAVAGSEAPSREAEEETSAGDEAEASEGDEAEDEAQATTPEP